MIFERSFITRHTGFWEGIGEYTGRKQEKLRFPGWIFLLAAFGAFVRLTQLVPSQRTLLDYFWIFLPALLAVIFLRLSADVQALRQILFRVEREEDEENPENIKIFLRSESSMMCAYSAADFTHVLFGLIDYPWPGRKDVCIEAYAVYLAKPDGESLCVMEASIDKLTAYRLAKRLSQLTRIPFMELGKGQPFSGRG